LKVGVIGAGFVARTQHLPTLKSIPSVEVVAIADVNEARAKRLAQEFNIPKYYCGYEELIKSNPIELVDICTPPQVRLKMVKSAAESGKNVLVEKPLALSLEEASEIYRLVKKHGIKLNVVQNYRYAPSAAAVRKRLSKGYLGEIVTIQGLASTPFPSDNTRSTWLYHPGGVLFDFAPHLIDMILWMNESRVRKVFAFGGDFTGGDMGFINYVHILLEFANGAVAAADASWLTGITRFILEIRGTAGHISLDVRNNHYMEVHGILTPFDEIKSFFKKMKTMAKDVITGNYFTPPYHKVMIMDYLKSLEKNEEGPVPVESGVITTAVLVAAQKSICENKAVDIEDLLRFSGMRITKVDIDC